MQESSSNIIVVDWSHGSDNPYYPQSASNIRTAGAYTALIEKQLGGYYTWCIGHSLGAHTCGHAGKIADIERITGQVASRAHQYRLWSICYLFGKNTFFYMIPKFQNLSPLSKQTKNKKYEKFLRIKRHTTH